MGFNITYKTLFGVQILHSYFLNQGNDEFDNMPLNKQKKVLQEYDLKNLIEIQPTKAAILKLKNNHLVFRLTKNGIQIEVKTSPNDSELPFTDIPLSLTLDFVFKIKDSYFENYTDINISSNKILYLSNVKPEDEPNTFPYIPLVANAVFTDTLFFVSEVSTAKIIKPLEEFEKRGLLGIISLKMQGDNSNLNILNNQKKIISPTPFFKIHFNNRKTFWKYTKSNSAFEVETTQEQPLTQNGFVEIDPLTDFTTNPAEASDYEYPNPSAKSIQKIGPKIYSQIFI